jgi:hypothetical protein
MKMKMKNTKAPRATSRRGVVKDTLRSYYLQNAIMLKLLALVPEFQEEVAFLRGDFEIDTSRFQSTDSEAAELFRSTTGSSGDFDLAEWRQMVIVQKIFAWFMARGYGVLAEGNGSTSGASYKKTQTDPFFKAMEKLGSRFNLPFNFYADGLSGVGCYVFTGLLATPPNSFVTYGPPIDGKSRWVDIRIFRPTTMEEIKKRIDEINWYYEREFPEILNVRARKEAWEMLPLVEEIIKRQSKPRRIKKRIVKKDSYASIVEKSSQRGSGPEISLRQFEKRYVKYKVEFDEPTSRAIAKKIGKSSGALRQEVLRLDNLARKLFGYGINPSSR